MANREGAAPAAPRHATPTRGEALLALRAALSNGGFRVQAQEVIGDDVSLTVSFGEPAFWLNLIVEERVLSPAQYHAARIRQYGLWQGPDEDLDALVALAERET